MFVINGHKCGMKLSKSDEWFGDLTELYYFCRLYEQRSQRNYQHPLHQLYFHGVGDSHLQAIRTRSVSMAGLCSFAGNICIRHFKLFPDGSHSEVYCLHAALIRSWRQLCHQPQSPIPMYQHTVGITIRLPIPSFFDEQFGGK